MNLISQSISNSGSIKSKAAAKLFDGIMHRRVKLWNDMEIVPCTLRTTVGREIQSKILKKTNMKKLVNKCGCFKN